jgi:hypothetical protein
MEWLKNTVDRWCFCLYISIALNIITLIILPYKYHTISYANEMEKQ